MNSLWKDHIFLDFKYSSGYGRALLECDNPNLLFEKFGQIPDLDDILDQNWKKFDEKKLKAGDYQIVPLTAPFLGTGCYVGAKYFPNGSKGSQRGVTRYTDSSRLENGKWYDVSILMSLEGAHIYEDFCTVLSHELLHLYDMAKRYRKVEKGEKTKEQIDWRPNYRIIQQFIDSGDIVERGVGTIAYVTFPGERSAFLSQMKQELFRVRDSLGTPEGCQKAIEDTTYYKYLQLCKKHLKGLSNLPESYRERVVQSVNTISGEGHECSSFNKAIKRLAISIDKAERKLQSIAGKLCYDIYTSYILGEAKSPLLIVDPKLDLGLTTGYDE